MAFLSGFPPFKPFGTIAEGFRVQQGTQVLWTEKAQRGLCPLDIDLTEHKDRAVISTDSCNMFEGERALNPECSAFFKLFGSSKNVQFVDGMFMREEGGRIFIEVPFVRLDEVLKKFGILEEARDAARAFVDNKKL